MEFTVKEYVDGDYKNYIQLLTKGNMEQLFIDNFGGWSDVVSEKKFFDVLKNGFVSLFFLEEVFVGFVSFIVEKNNCDSFLINDLHVVKDFQKKGYGSKILRFVESKASDNIKQLKVFVFKNNSSITFYEKNGFKEIDFLEKSSTSVMVKVI